MLDALADRPKKAFILKTSLLGTYEKIASWAAEIHTDILPDCKRCFQKSVEIIISNNNCTGFPVNNYLSRCACCYQWDLDSTSYSLKKKGLPEKYPRVTANGSPDPPGGQSIKEK